MINMFKFIEFGFIFESVSLMTWIYIAVGALVLFSIIGVLLFAKTMITFLKFVVFLAFIAAIFLGVVFVANNMFDAGWFNNLFLLGDNVTLQTFLLN